MSGGIESMHEDQPQERRDKFNSDINAALQYYDWARRLPADQAGRAAVELCHQLILLLANYEHERRKRGP